MKNLVTLALLLITVPVLSVGAGLTPVPMQPVPAAKTAKKAVTTPPQTTPAPVVPVTGGTKTPTSVNPPRPGTTFPAVKSTPSSMPITGASTCGLGNTYENNLAFAREMKSAGVRNETEVAVALKARCVSARDAVKILTLVYPNLSLSGNTPRVMANILHIARYETEAIGGMLKISYSLGAEEVFRLLWSVDIRSSTEHANVLKAVFNLGPEATVSIFRKAGYGSPPDVVRALNMVFYLNAKATARVLKLAGYSANFVTNGLKAQFNISSRAAVFVLKEAGYAATEVARAHEMEFNNPGAEATATLLKTAGYDARDTAAALGSVYRLVNDAIKPILRTAGFTESEIANALR